MERMNASVPSTMDGRPIKMRATCDTCAQSKIKCDKLRPSCMRCSSLGLRCHYSPSLRTGKQPKVKKGASDTQSTPRHLSSPGFNSPHTPSAGLTSSLYDMVPDQMQQTTNPEMYQYIKNWDSGLDAGTQDTFYYDISDVQDIPMFSAVDDDSMSSFTYPMTPGSIMQWQEGIHQQAPLPQPLQPHPESLCGGGESNNSLYSGQQSTVGAQSIPACWNNSKLGQAKPDCTCTKAAFATLKSLYPLAAAGEEGPWGTARLVTTDQVLSTNKAGLECVQRILACPCSTDPYFMVTVAVMLQRIIGWYRDVAVQCTAAAATSSLTNSPLLQQLQQSRAVYSPSSPSSSCSSSSSTDHHPSSSSLHSYPTLLPTATTTTTTTGLFDTDPETDRRIRANMILNELKAVELVLDAYAARVGQMRNSSSSKRNGHGGLDDSIAVFTALEHLMRARLEETIGCCCCSSAGGAGGGRLSYPPSEFAF